MKKDCQKGTLGIPYQTVDVDVQSNLKTKQKRGAK